MFWVKVRKGCARSKIGYSDTAFLGSQGAVLVLVQGSFGSRAGEQFWFSCRGAVLVHAKAAKEQRRQGWPFDPSGINRLMPAKHVLGGREQGHRLAKNRTGRFEDAQMRAWVGHRSHERKNLNECKFYPRGRKAILGVFAPLRPLREPKLLPCTRTKTAPLHVNQNSPLPHPSLTFASFKIFFPHARV